MIIEIRTVYHGVMYKDKLLDVNGMVYEADLTNPVLLSLDDANQTYLKYNSGYNNELKIVVIRTNMIVM